MLFDDSNPLFHRCLDPYRSKGAIYLRSCEIDTATMESQGQFSIAESCYIDDTGHFNAAEFVMCYNQLMYMSLCAGVFHKAHPFENWSMEDFWERQLPHVLIQQLDSRYTRPINARNFSGKFVIDEVDFSRRERGIVKLHTSVEFSDATGGRARG
ncbi:FcoT family thioesterase, partial [Corynebacterium felinum]